MIERALLVVGMIALACVAGYLVRARARRRTAALSGSDLPSQLGERLNFATAGIVYFYGPHCATCRRQADVLTALTDSDTIPVVRIDASRETHLADELGVMTVPATVVVDSSQQIRSVNLGFRSADALRAQLLDAVEDLDRSRASA